MHNYTELLLQALFYKKYSVQSDVWSFGCVMYEIWSLGYKPFEDYSGTEVYVAIMAMYKYLILQRQALNLLLL